MLMRYPITANLALRPSAEDLRALSNLGVPVDVQEQAYERLASDLERIEASRRAERLGSTAVGLLWAEAGGQSNSIEE